MRSESFGRPVGTIDLYQTFYSTVQKKVQLHDSNRAIHADEGDEVMKFAQSKMKIAVAEKETKNPDGTQQTVVRLSGFPAKKTRGCADELDDLWDDVGVGSVIKRCDVSDGEDGDDKQNKKRRKATTPRKNSRLQATLAVLRLHNLRVLLLLRRSRR